LDGGFAGAEELRGEEGVAAGWVWVGHEGGDVGFKGGGGEVRGQAGEGEEPGCGGGVGEGAGAVGEPGVEGLLGDFGIASELFGGGVGVFGGLGRAVLVEFTKD
jgi:hypothetical protein